MDNKKAITILQSVRANTVNALIAKVAIRKALDMAIAALEQQEKDRWIPVSEALPEDYTDVLSTPKKNTRRNPMAEYIAKKLAIELMRQSSYLSDGDLLEVNGNLAKARIEAEPAADVAPVVHGEWIRSGVEGHIICNKCGYEAKHTIVERQDAIGKWVSWFAQDMKTNFCPNCGADMRGEQDG